MALQQARRIRVPAVYGGAIVLLVLAGLALRGFSFDIGDARVVGRYSLFPLLGSSSVDSLTVSWNGLSLRFSRSTLPGLGGIGRGDSGDGVVIGDGGRVQISGGTDPGRSLRIATAAGSGPLSIPFSIAGVRTDPPAGTALAWSSAGAVYVLTLPAGARVNADDGTITLPGAAAAVLSRSGTTAVAAAPTVPKATVSRPAAAPQKLPAEKDLPGAADLQAAVAGWTDAAWAALSGPRYAAADGTWALAGGARGISDDLGVMYLAESVARGAWKNAFAAWTDAAARARGRGDDAGFSFPTSVYIGNTAEYARAAAPRSAAALDKAKSLLAANDPAVFALPDLVPLLRGHGSADLVASARALATSKAAASVGVPAALGVGEALVALADPGAAGDAARSVLRDLVSRTIVPALRATDAGVFLAAASGTVDVPASLRCGALLLAAGSALQDSRTAALGRGLLVASLSLADEGGTLPATLRLSGAKIAGRSGSTAPESVYADLPTGRPLPHEVSLAGSLGAGVTVFTAAAVSVRAADNGAAVVFSYPAGVPHYYVITGLRPFSQVTLHEIPWHADPSYARYSDGWYYDADARVFYGKLTGRTGQEEIDIAF